MIKLIVKFCGAVSVFALIMTTISTLLTLSGVMNGFVIHTTKNGEGFTWQFILLITIIILLCFFGTRIITKKLTLLNDRSQFITNIALTVILATLFLIVEIDQTSYEYSDVDIRVTSDGFYIGDRFNTDLEVLVNEEIIDHNISKSETVVLTADGNISYQRVSDSINKLKSLGFEKVALGARK